MKFKLKTFLISFLIIGALTILSYLITFGYEEGMGNELIGKIGYHVFSILRFPSHNLLWPDQGLLDKFFHLGLLVNVLLYAIVITVGLSNVRKS